MEKKVILLGSRLLVTPDEVSDKLSDVIDVVKTDVQKAADRPCTGIIEDIADDCRFVRKGDRIHFNPWAGLEVEISNLQLVGVKKKKFLIMSESEVMMITDRNESA